MISTFRQLREMHERTIMGLKRDPPHKKWPNLTKQSSMGCGGLISNFLPTSLPCPTGTETGSAYWQDPNF